MNTQHSVPTQEIVVLFGTTAVALCCGSNEKSCMSFNHRVCICIQISVKKVLGLRLGFNGWRCRLNHSMIEVPNSPFRLWTYPLWQIECSNSPAWA